jgi:hypothetical protein
MGFTLHAVLADSSTPFFSSAIKTAGSFSSFSNKNFLRIILAITAPKPYIAI